MLKGIAYSVFFIALVGCSESPAPSSEAPMPSANNTQSSPTVRQPAPPIPKIEVQKVDIHDDQAIVDAAGLPVEWKSDSTDSDDQPKKIYGFTAKDKFGTQVELSKNWIVIGWQISKESPEIAAQSETNILTAKKIAGAVLGEDGVNLVAQVTGGNPMKSGMVGGYKISSATCVSYQCGLKIAR